jgi:hypothetical protein
MKQDCRHCTEGGIRWLDTGSAGDAGNRNRVAANFLSKHADVAARAVGVDEGDHAALARIVSEPIDQAELAAWTAPRWSMRRTLKSRWRC